MNKSKIHLNLMIKKIKIKKWNLPLINMIQFYKASSNTCTVYQTNAAPIKLNKDNIPNLSKYSIQILQKIINILICLIN